MSKVLEFEYTSRTVPQDSLGVFNNVCEDFLCFRTDIQTFPTIRNLVNRTELSVGVVRESVSDLSVNSQYQVYTFFFSFCYQVKSQVQFVIFANGNTDLSTHSLSESISHTTGDDQVINLTQQVFDDFDFRRNLRTTHDSSERTFDVIQYFINSFHFFLHQVTEHLVVFVEIFSDQSRRSVCTVSCTESVVYVAVSIRSQFLGEFFLAFFYGFLGGSFFFVCRIFCQTAGFAFLFSIETKILKQQHFTRLQSSSFYSSFFAHTVVSELHLNTQQF